MKKRLLILMTVTGMIILLGGLLTYGLGVHEIIPVPRPDLIVVGTSLIGILLIVSGVCDLFVKKTKEMEIEENDERNISLSNAAMASGFKVMNVTIAVSIFALIFTGYMTIAGRQRQSRSAGPVQGMSAKQHRSVYHRRGHEAVLLSRSEGMGTGARLSARHMPGGAG